MAEEYQIAWAIYGAGVVVLLAAGWWFMRNWNWSWMRNFLLLLFASVLLVPAKGIEPEGPLMPLLPLFAYQTVFEEDGATPEVSASLVFAAGSALAIMLIVGFVSWSMRRRKYRRMTENDQF